MASAPKRVTKTTVTTPTKAGGTKRVSTTTTRQGGNVTTTKSTTVTGPKKATKAKKAQPAKKTASKKAAKPAKLARAALGSDWICELNEERQLCVPVALANALLGATGVEASNGQIERLYARAGGIGDTGVPVLSALAATLREGLAGCRLKKVRPAALDDADLLLLDFPGQGLHAAAFAGMHVIAWGAEIPLGDLDARIIDAWSLTWHGQEVAVHG